MRHNGNRGHSGYNPVQISVQQPNRQQDTQPPKEEPSSWQEITASQPSAQPEQQPPALPAENRTLPATHKLPSGVRFHLGPKPGVVVPQQFPASWLYAINRKLNRADPKDREYLRVPPLGKRERVRYDEYVIDAVMKDLIKRLRFLASFGISPVMSYCNIKSAGKTSAALGVGNVIAEYTRKNTLLFPASFNTATGTAGLASGINGATMTVTEYKEDLKDLGAYRTLSRRVPRTNWGLGVIFEDRNSAADDDDVVKTKEFMDLIDTTLPNVDVLILDHGNDNISKKGIVLQAVRLSHTVNFPFIADDPVTLNMLNRTITGYNTDMGIPGAPTSTFEHYGQEADSEDVSVWAEYYQPFQSKEHAGIGVDTSVKIMEACVIATKARFGSGVDFQAVMKPNQQGANARTIPEWVGDGICVPDDASIGQKDKMGNLMPFDLDALNKLTHIAYLQIAVANFQKAAKHQGINLELANYSPLHFSGKALTPPASAER